MKVLLINPSKQKEIHVDKVAKVRNNLPPLGLLYIASYLKSRHDIKVIDMSLSQSNMKDLIETIDNFSPDVVGLTSVITLWGTVVELIRAVKQHNPSITIVVGGPNASKYPEETLSHPEVDYVIVGIGQKPLMALCDTLEKGERDFRVENCFIHGVKYDSYGIVNTKEYRLDNYPFPDRRATPCEHYHASICPEAPTTSMVSSMGCPYKCAYCSCRIDQAYQLRSEDKVVDEMAEIESMGIRSILFQDELFTLKSSRVKRICKGIIDRGVKLNWLVKSRIDSIKPEMLEPMKEAGCFNIHFGIESGNDTTLERMRKGYTTAKVVEIIKMVKAAGMSCTGNFMLAYPGEDEKDILNTIDFAAELQLDMANFFLTHNVPMTDLYYEGIKAGRQSKDAWSEYTRNPVNGDSLTTYASDSFAEEQLHNFLDLAFSRTRTLFDLNREDNIL
jgi:radical SAM superfamily enzyme YgiQ (UPF0313 family)